MIRYTTFSTPLSLLVISLIFLFSTEIVYGQANHNHEHNHDSSHSHSHDQNNAIIDSSSHTHLPVDYSFRPNAGQYEPPEPDEDGYYWWKGNLHTHTLWSDGDQFPEVSTQWYYEHGYHFLALSDHNTFLSGKKWINMENRPDVYELYHERFGDDWIESRTTDDEVEVRLKPLAEVRSLFEAAGRFLMINAEEITTGEHIVHVNATNIKDYIEPQTGDNVEETIRLNIDAVVNQRDETGQEMIPHLNHPNFRNAVTAGDMAPVENLRLFEIYNGHRGVLNFGDENGTESLDRVWDIVLTKRLAELDLGPVFGVAVDDAHNYETSSSQTARPGRGWINIRSRYLTAEHMVRALEKGDFYSSSGVGITEAKSDGNEYSVKVDPEEGVDYTIQYIGTKEDYDASSEPYLDEDGNVRNDRTRLYSADIGEVLQETSGTEASYEFEGDELYVRVKIISSKLKENYFVEGEVEQAWLQPLLPGQSYGE